MVDAKQHDAIITRAVDKDDADALQVHLLDAMGADALAVAKRLKLLQRASRKANLACVHLLLKEGAPVNGTTAGGATALWLASKAGHADVVRALLEAGADQHKFTGAVLSPLGEACRGGHGEVIRALVLVRPNGSTYELERDPSKLLSLALERGHAKALRLLLELLLEVDKPKRHGLNVGEGCWRVDKCPGRKVFCRAIQKGDLPCVQVLSSFCARGAPRWHPLLTFAAADGAADGGGSDDNQHYDEWSYNEEDGLPPSAEALAWLRATRGATPLHHLEVLSVTRTRALLRADVQGTAVHARLANNGASVLELAGNVAAGQPGYGAAQLVLQAAAPWSPERHALWPAAWRARAVELFLLGQLLAYTTAGPGPFTGEEESIKDAWVHFVVPRVLERERHGYQPAQGGPPAGRTRRLPRA